MPQGTNDPSIVAILDRRAPWLVECMSALSRRTGVRAYSALSLLAGALSNRLERVAIADPPLDVIEFPVQRGYFSSPLKHLLWEHRRIAAWLRRDLKEPGAAWLLCCYPHYWKVAALWPGPVAYYVTDFFSHYVGRSYGDIAEAEKELCRRAALVFPNSRRVAEFLASERGCDADKIHVVPNAVRESNLLAAPAVTPSALPPDCAGLPRPVAGIIGNMAANTDWELLERVVAATPWLSWLFVGPADAPIKDPKQARARAGLLAAGGRVRFLGSRPYGELKAYARGLDVAILPYIKREPTYSGSSTRFYEHLAACRPILSSRGFEELLHKEPLLKHLGEPEEWISALGRLREQGFRDGLEELRWRQSRSETWEERAQRLHLAMSWRESRLATAPI
ncbi:MAG TPA: glycosyltransferase [Bryobacteraceae bacterium]|nr:glycosyltransferase [Bryobacteraceae bacterium]